MKIIEKTYSFGAMNTRSRTTRIIIHHAAATSCTADDIHRWHKNNGWAGIGYHFFVRKDGSVYRGRPQDKVGAHASGENSDSIGICFEGNYETEKTMPAAQKKAGAELVAYLKNYYKITKVLKHKDVNATACPGKNFPFNEIVNYKEGEEDVDIKKLKVKSLDTGKMIEVEAVNVNGSNYVKLRDLEKMMPVKVDYDGKNPTINLSYK